MKKTSKKPWYQAGLAFQCRQCGNCCAGPDEGYVWINKIEILKLADFLKISPQQLKNDYLRRVGVRYSLIEKQPSKDCIFLSRNPDHTVKCDIYPVRPLQCRTWPFWNENLRSPATWKHAAQKCPGINHGLWYDLKKISALGRADLSHPNPEISKEQAAASWIKNNLNNKPCLEAVEKIYRQIDRQIESTDALCQNCGQCCDFDNYDHRLYATTLEMLYFVHHLPNSNSPTGYPIIKPLDNGRCPCQNERGCKIYHARTTGCRIFFCRQLDKNSQNDLAEKIQLNLQKIHQQFHAVYLYAELGQWLNILGHTLNKK